MQHLVRVGYGEEREKRLAWLKAKGYKGAIAKDYKYGVIIIAYDYFFGGNITCFAAHVSCGNKVLSCEEWQRVAWIK